MYCDNLLAIGLSQIERRIERVKEKKNLTILKPIQQMLEGCLPIREHLKAEKYQGRSTSSSVMCSQRKLGNAAPFTSLKRQGRGGEKRLHISVNNRNNSSKHSYCKQCVGKVVKPCFQSGNQPLAVMDLERMLAIHRTRQVAVCCNLPIPMNSYAWSLIILTHRSDTNISPSPKAVVSPLIHSHP